MITKLRRRYTVMVRGLQQCCKMYPVMKMRVRRSWSLQSMRISQVMKIRVESHQQSPNQPLPLSLPLPLKQLHSLKLS